MNKKHTITMFSVPPLMVFEYKGDMNKILEYTSSIEYLQEGYARSKDDYILDDENLKDLKDFCLDCVHEYVKEVVNIDEEIGLQQSWVNLSQPGENQNGDHYHPNSFVSGVFYIFSDQEKGAPIKFKSDLHKSNFGAIQGDYLHFQYYPKDRHTYCPSNSAEFTYPSIPGQLLLFSSTITHMVPKNMSDQKRMSIAFNTYPKLPFGNKLGLTYLRGG